MLFTGTTVHVAKANLFLYSQHQLFAPTSALDSCLASHGYKHLLRLFSWLLPTHSHFKSHLFSWESPLGQDDYGTHGSGYHSFLVRATEVDKYMPSPLLSASQWGSSHSPPDTQGLAEKVSNLEWGHPPPQTMEQRELCSDSNFVCHCGHIWKLSPRWAQSPANNAARLVAGLINSLKKDPAFCKPLLAVALYLACGRVPHSQSSCARPLSSVPLVLLYHVDAHM